MASPSSVAAATISPSTPLENPKSVSLDTRQTPSP